MTHFLQRTILMALATSAVGATAAYGQVLPPLSSAPRGAMSAGDFGVDTAARTHRHHAKAAPAHRKAKAKPDAADDDSAADSDETNYTVREGDTLEKIAKKFATTVATLRENNGIRPGTKLMPGDVVAVPGKGGGKHSRESAEGRSKAPETRPTTYDVAAGDTLYSISKRFGVSLEALQNENGLSRKSRLRVGQTLRLPGDHAETASSRRESADETGDTERAPTRGSRRSSSRSTRVEETRPEEPGERTLTTRSVAGRVIEVEGGEVNYTVRKGDTLEKIAKKLHTTVAKLREENGLTRHTKILPGDVVAGPAGKTKAYVAESGDTLGEIARRFGVSESELRSANGISRRASIRAGEKIKLPAGYHDHGPLTTSIRVPAPAAESPEESPSPRAYTPTERPRPPVNSPRPYTPPATAARPYTPPPAAAPSTSAPPSATDLQIAQLGAGRFIWPLQGQIVSDFGPKSEGQRNDGINISAQGGEPVRAAAAGDVVYAGNQVPGFGNLVLIKHNDGWVTAYAHLQRIEVKNQQHVQQGQEVGLAGMTGGVATPQLHFEIRYAATPTDRAKPIDPKLVLPH